MSAEPNAVPEEYGTKCTSCGCNRRKPAPRLCMSPNEHVEFIPAKLPKAAPENEPFVLPKAMVHAATRAYNAAARRRGYKYFHDAFVVEEALIAALDTQKAQPDGWIAVTTETMPTDRKAKLVWCPERKNRYMACWIEGNWWVFGAHRTQIDEEVTHWAEPLPTPPVQAVQEKP